MDRKMSLLSKTSLFCFENFPGVSISTSICDFQPVAAVFVFSLGTHKSGMHGENRQSLQLITAQFDSLRCVPSVTKTEPVAVIYQTNVHQNSWPTLISTHWSAPKASRQDSTRLRKFEISVDLLCGVAREAGGEIFDRASMVPVQKDRRRFRD